jgi:predicted TIM-barrel fold metal-dependent hydrolase
MKTGFVLFALMLAGCVKQAAPLVDADLAAEIAKIRVVDNHAHPVRPTAVDEPADTGFDALPVENLEASTDPVRFRPGGNPFFARAGQAVFNGDKAAAVKSWGSNYAATVLDRAGIDRMVANRVSMGPGLPPERFLWAGYVDALMYPFPTDAIADTPDRKAFFRLEAGHLADYKRESAATGASLDEYLTQIVTPTLERHKRSGAIAEKFEMAYLRSLAVGNPPREDAERVWRAGAMNRADYRTLQDFLFRYIATECGRLGMAVQIHTGAGGGGYFDVSGSNPANLEPLLNDPALRRTNFVMLHGGWPFSRQATALLTKPNAYIDVSVQGLILPPSDVAQSLRAWLETAPGKVLFGTDAYPIAPAAGMGWEETAWASTEAVRQALGMALTGMVNEGSVTRERAKEIARMVLRENALKLYGLK